MRLKDWAKKNSITYRTAWEHFRTGKIPNAYKLESGTIIVPEKEIKNKSEKVITYARVSSSENKLNLLSQSERITNYCNAKGWKVSKSVAEVGSGLNDNRRKLLKILEDETITKLVVEHKDRLARFGVRYIECLCKHIGCDLVIINNTSSDKEDLMQDFVSLVTSFCSRLYGLRRSKRKTEKLIRDLKNENK